MNIADKIMRAKEDYDAVYEAGKKSMVDESKIIEKTVSGSVIALDDVSEVPHEVVVQLSNSEENLIPYPYTHTTQTHNGITFTDNGDRTITISGVATNDAYFYLCTNDFGNNNAWNTNVVDGYLFSGTHIFYNGVNTKVTCIVVPSGRDYTTPITVNPYIKRVSEDFSGVEVKVFGQNIFSNVVTSSVANPLTKINSTTYSITPDMNNGKMYGIRADVSTLPLEIGDVLKCSVKSISKIGATYGWRVEYQDGTYNSVSNSLNATLTVNKPFKALLLYCDMGSAGFSYEPIVFTDVVVYKESEMTNYTANADGTVSGIKSLSPYMTISTDTNGVNITATYHKSWGMQTEYDRFWDAYQNNGEAMDYSYSFAGINWDDDCYNPKYPIKCTNCTNMLRNAIITDTKVPIDISNGSGTYVLANCRNLVRIPKIIVDANVIFTGWLTSCTALEEIRFEGTIGKSLDLHFSTKLSMMSLASIVGALSDTVTGQTITLPTTAQSTYDSATISGRWKELVASKPNWTFAYA